MTDSYCWGLTKNGSFILGGAFPQKHARAAFEALKKKCAGACGFPLKKRLYVEACQVLRPRPFGFCPGSDGIFLVGEAGGFICSSSLEGISHAMESGRRLGNVFLSESSGGTGVDFAAGTAYNAAYKKATVEIARKLFFKNLRAPFMYQSFLRRFVMKSGLTSLRVIPGSIV